MASQVPETLDAKYIAEVLGQPLTSALAEVAEKRPWDPIEFLAQWLYKYKANQAYHQKQEDAVKEAERSEREKQEEAESRVRRRQEAEQLKKIEEEKVKAKAEEEKRLKEQEEIQKKAKDSVHVAQPPELPTVTEDNEDTEATAATAATMVSPRTVVEKDEQGLTKLHKLVESGTVDEVKAFLATPEAVDLLSERDVQGRNARDMAASDEIRGCLDEYVTELFKSDKLAEITKLMENGYPLSALNLNSDELELPEVSKDLLAKATELPSLLEEICTSVKKGDLRTVKHSIEKKAYAVSRLNAEGATALHLAVLTGKPDVIEYIATCYPSTVQCRDFMNRTPLHYAHTLPDIVCTNVVKLLAAADKTAVDCKSRKPEELKGSEELKQMAELLVSAEQAPAAEGEQAPAAEGEQAPAAEGEQAPATEGEQAPAAEGEQAPAAEGEQAPAADGEQAPAADGEQAPAADGEQAPAADAE